MSAKSVARRNRALILLAALALCQFVLHGPSLLGQQILLPLDVLTQDGFYLPRTEEVRAVVPHNRVLDDQVLEYEMARRFAVAEVRAGRIPLWSPFDYAGTPFVTWGKYSPFSLLHYLFPSPITLAWVQLLKSLVAGVGAYLFLRRVPKLGFWPALVGGCCYPLTGFFVLWQGYPLTLVVAWYPWVLLATDSVVDPGAGGGRTVLRLGVFTALAIVAGQLDTAAQVLLASGFYGLWRSLDLARRTSARNAAPGAARLATGWLLGLMLASPYWMPLVEYSLTGVRFAERGAGLEERPPVGLGALPQVVLPDAYGSTQRGSVRIVPGNQLESAAAAYAGLPATLLLLPLGWSARRQRSHFVLSAVMALLGLGWQLDAPGLVSLLRLAPLNMLSHNRLVFVSGFALLTLAAIGLEALTGALPRRRFAVPVALMLLAALWCGYRAGHLPEPVASGLAAAVSSGHPSPAAPDIAAVREVQATFVRSNLTAAGLALVAIGVLLTPRPAFSLGVLMVADLLSFAHGVNPQCSPAWYFPRIPVLARLAAAAPGRVLPVGCLPASLHQSHGLRDVRGYDGVDPARLLDLLEIAAARHGPAPSFGRVRSYLPALRRSAGGQLEVSPVLSLLNVRYLVFRGEPPASVDPLFSEGDYWAVENQNVLPRAFIPARVRRTTEGETLTEMERPDFDPRAVAYVDAGSEFGTEPVGMAVGPGSASIVAESPTRVELAVEMQAPGLVVLADRWDRGWEASLNGHAAPILRVDHALRGIAVPAGPSGIVFRYSPASLRSGVLLSALAALLMLASLLGRRPAESSGRRSGGFWGAKPPADEEGRPSDLE